MDQNRQKKVDLSKAERQTWISPEIQDLPPLEDLTLQTAGIPGLEVGARGLTIFK